MVPSSRLIDRSLALFAEALATRTATPGGGSMAAFLTASGAALVSMACRFTSGEKFAVVEPAMVQSVVALELLRPRALELVDLDAASYDAVTAAYGLAKSNDAEKALRAAAIQLALKGALDVPFETMQIALAGLEIAAPIAASINPNLKSDCGVGARCLATALESAFLNVRINAGSIKDGEFVAERLRQCDAMRTRARELSEQIARVTEA